MDTIYYVDFIITVDGLQLKCLPKKGSESLGTQTVNEDQVLAFPRGTQTEKASSEDQDIFVKLVQRISLSPEPMQRPKNIFSNIRTPTYFTSAISASLMMGTPGNLEHVLGRPFGASTSTTATTTTTARHQIGRLVNNEINRLVNVAS